LIFDRFCRKLGGEAHRFCLFSRKPYIYNKNEGKIYLAGDKKVARRKKDPLRRVKIGCEMPKTPSGGYEKPHEAEKSPRRARKCSQGGKNPLRRVSEGGFMSSKGLCRWIFVVFTVRREQQRSGNELQ
jgi:hypothetical protein